MGIIGTLTKYAGESLRMKREVDQEKNLDPLTKQLLEELKQQAQNGDTDAMVNLGVCYIRGQYVGYDPEKACFWWTEAANRGHVLAQYNLGLLYEGELSTFYGDFNLAGYWFNIASHNGDPNAYARLQAYKYSSSSGKWKYIGR